LNLYPTFANLEPLWTNRDTMGSIEILDSSFWCF